MEGAWARGACTAGASTQARAGDWSHACGIVAIFFSHVSRPAASAQMKNPRALVVSSCPLLPSGTSRSYSLSHHLGARTDAAAPSAATRQQLGDTGGAPCVVCVGTTDPRIPRSRMRAPAARQLWHRSPCTPHAEPSRAAHSSIHSARRTLHRCAVRCRRPCSAFGGKVLPRELPHGEAVQPLLDPAGGRNARVGAQLARVPDHRAWRSQHTAEHTP